MASYESFAERQARHARWDAFEAAGPVCDRDGCSAPAIKAGGCVAVYCADHQPRRDPVAESEARTRRRERNRRREFEHKYPRRAR